MKVIPRGLYGKLVLSVSLIVIAVISVFGFITYKQQALRIETTATENLMLMAKSLSLSCADDLIVRDYARMETYLKRFAELRNVFEIQVYDESGNILSDIVLEYPLQPRSRYGPKKINVRNLSAPSVNIEKGQMVALYPITAGNVIGWVKIYYELREISYMRTAILRNTLLVNVLGILISLLALIIVLRPPMRLIKKLSDFAKNLDKIKGETIPVNRSYLEIEQLCEALNYASQRIDTTEKALIQHSEDLEKQVAGRTAELIRSNELLQDELIERTHIEEALGEKNRELERTYSNLKATQSQLLQREKMASIGQLAAGVAHEINNPMGFIISNMGTLGKYTERLKEFIRILEEGVKESQSGKASENQNLGIEDRRRSLKIDYIFNDLGNLINESLDGAERVKKIVQNLKTFSRLDEAEHKMVNINEELESVINILWNELKYKTTLKREYGDIPKTECNPGQLGQVFMNLLVNAADAIEGHGEITVKTWYEAGNIHVSISDTGSGIPEDKLGRIFEPFFTTKEVGKGTGLGLSIAYDIIKKHKGEITVKSEVAKGTLFTIRIPVNH